MPMIGLSGLCHSLVASMMATLTANSSATLASVIVGGHSPPLTILPSLDLSQMAQDDLPGLTLPSVYAVTHMLSPTAGSITLHLRPALMAR